MREISTVGIMVVYFALCSPISGAQTIDRPVKWHFTAISPGGKKATLIFTATMAEHWHIYSQIPSAHGPWPTTFTFFPGNNYSLDGIVKEQTPLKKYDNVFLREVECFDKTVVFSQDIDLHNSDTTISGKIGFMNCTYSFCLPPDEINFTLDVKEVNEKNNKRK